MSSEEGLRVEKRYERLIKIFSDKETELFTEWAATVPETVDIGLNRNILSRESDSTTLILNFDPELLGVLKEVNYLKQMSRSDIPEHAMKVPLTHLLFTYNSLRTDKNFTHSSSLSLSLSPFQRGVGKRGNVPQVSHAVVRHSVLVQQDPQDEQAG